MTKDEALKEAFAALKHVEDVYCITYEEAMIAIEQALALPNPVLAEREACAKECEKWAEEWDRNSWEDTDDEKYSYKGTACQECADSIRERSRP